MWSLGHLPTGCVFVCLVCSPLCLQEEEEEDRLRSISRTQVIRFHQLDRQGQVHVPKHCDTVIKYQPPYHMGVKVVSA